LVLVEDDLNIKIEDLPGFLTAQNDNVLVSLNTSISKDLADEGFAREFVNFLQSLRKSSGFAVTDMILVGLSGDKKAIDIVLKHQKYISGEVLASSIFESKKELTKSTLFEFNNYKMYIAIQE